MRYISWFVDNTDRDGTAQGPSFVLDQDYTLLDGARVRMNVRQAPDAAVLTADIKADGTSIFGAIKPSILIGRTLEEDFDSFGTTTSLPQYTVLTLDLVSGGARGITVTLELPEEA